VWECRAGSPCEWSGAQSGIEGLPRFQTLERIFGAVGAGSGLVAMLEGIVEHGALRQIDSGVMPLTVRRCFRSRGGLVLVCFMENAGRVGP
jgi:hypothetical protein